MYCWLRAEKSLFSNWDINPLRSKQNSNISPATLSKPPPNPSLVSRSQETEMAHLQIHTPGHSTTILCPTFSFHYPLPLRFSLPRSSLKTHTQNSIFSTTTTTKNVPFSISMLPRKLLCQPPHGTYVRHDYLVVRPLIDFTYAVYFLVCGV